MNVLHSVLDNLTDLLQSLERPESRDGVPLDQDVALSQKFNGLQRGAIWTNQTLASTHESLLISYERFDFDYVTCYIILQHTCHLEEKTSQSWSRYLYTMF